MITPEQFKNWKEHPVGKVFFDFLEERAKFDDKIIEHTVSYPANYTQEEFYKKNLEFGIKRRTTRDIISLKLIDIQEEEQENEQEDEATK